MKYIILLLLFICISICYTKEKEKDTNIDVNNPYSLAVKMRVKCDWNNEIEDFIYDKEIYIPKKSKNKIKIPYGLKNCQIWPKVIFFGD